MLVPIALPPGVFRNGTPYSGKNRWYSANLVRWHDNAVRPIGGWQRRARQSDGADMPALYPGDTERVRDAYAWRRNNGSRYAVFGSNAKLYLMLPDNSVITITPTGAYVGPIDIVSVVGYGAGPYGQAAYGVKNTAYTPEVGPVTRWRFDSWGQNLMALQTDVGPLYVQGNVNSPLVAVPNSPTGCADFVVTKERIVMALGGSNGPRAVRWSDQEDREMWTPGVSNQAGDIMLSGVGKLLCAINTMQMVLILSETDAHVARYVGPPYVYSFDLVGDNCGPVSPFVVASTADMAVWLGEKSFWIFDGTVKPLPSDITDFLYADADPDRWSKANAFVNAAFSEVWWLYQSKTAPNDDIDCYVTWNYRDNTWNVGKLQRTAATGTAVFDGLLMVTTAGAIFDHELPDKLPTGSMFLETGPLEVGNGDINMAVRQVFMDTDLSDDVTVQFYYKQFPYGPEFSKGPYAFSNPINTRVMGRQVRMRINGLTEPFKIGNIRLDVAPQGTGRR